MAVSADKHRGASHTRILVQMCAITNTVCSDAISASSDQQTRIQENFISSAYTMAETNVYCVWILYCLLSLCLRNKMVGIEALIDRL